MIPVRATGIIPEAMFFGACLIFLGCYRKGNMTTDEQADIDRLCVAVLREKDNPIKLTELVAELSQVLESRERKAAESKPTL